MFPPFLFVGAAFCRPLIRILIRKQSLVEFLARIFVVKQGGQRSFADARQGGQRSLAAKRPSENDKTLLAD